MRVENLLNDLVNIGVKIELLNQDLLLQVQWDKTSPKELERIKECVEEEAKILIRKVNAILNSRPGI